MILQKPYDEKSEGICVLCENVVFGVKRDLSKGNNKNMIAWNNEHPLDEGEARNLFICDHRKMRK